MIRRFSTTPLALFRSNVTMYVWPRATPPGTRMRAEIVQSLRSGAVCWPTLMSLPPRKTRHVIPTGVPLLLFAQYRRV